MANSAIATRFAPQAIGPYSQGVRADGACLHVSGQLAIDPDTGTITGDDIQTQTRQCLNNIKAILDEAGADMSAVAETTVLLTDIDEFAAMNEVYAEFFREPYPARAAFQVVALPKKGAKVEIRAVAYL